MSRYQIVEGSETGHCCFECTIVDTNFVRGVTISGGKRYEYLAECFEFEDAEFIAEALNNYNDVWHENMASEAIASILAEYIDTIDGDLSHAFGVY